MKRRQVEARLALYDDLAGILGAMRSFALAELHRLLRREEAQHAVAESVELALQDLGAALPEPPPSPGDVWLLLGSVRGFCGSFNEDVLRAWRRSGDAAAPVVAVGERLGVFLPPAITAVPGAMGAPDASAAIDRILAAVAHAGRRYGGSGGLVVCYRDKDASRCQRLLPLPRPQDGDRLPVTLEPAPRVAAQVAEQMLFHRLLSLLLRSLRIENQMRLAQMESALGYLQRGTEELRRQRNRLRQEEIIEEIEIMITRKASHSMGAANHVSP